MRLKREAGFTVVEVLVVCSLLLVVMGATLALLDQAAPMARKDQERSIATSEAQTEVYAMTRELRQARTIYAASPTAVDFGVVSPAGVARRVLLDCSWQPGGSIYRQCVRAVSTDLAVAPTASGGSPAVDRVINGTAADPSDPVFTYTPSSAAPTYIGVHLNLPAGGGLSSGGYSSRITFDGGAYLDNLGAQ